MARIYTPIHTKARPTENKALKQPSENKSDTAKTAKTQKPKKEAKEPGD